MPKKKRITVTIDEELDKKIRNVQVRLISSTHLGWSYSSVLESLVKDGFESNSVKKLAKTRII